MKVLLFTLLPAGLISHLPVELVRHFTWHGAGIAVSGAGAYLLFVLFVFDRGLRRYESGSRIGVGN
jgi:ABC-2 type transport system permease protein